MIDDFDDFMDIDPLDYDEYQEGFDETSYVGNDTSDTETDSSDADTQDELIDSPENEKQENPDKPSGSGVSFGAYRGACTQCSCRSFFASPGDYVGNTCVCGHSYYFHTEGGYQQTSLSESNNIPFKGAIEVQSIANLQDRSTCGGESLANVVELSTGIPDLGLCEKITSDAETHGYVVYHHDGSRMIYEDYYQTALQKFGIEANWSGFDHINLQRSLDADHGVLGIVDAHYLNPMYPPNSRHAITITNYDVDCYGHVARYCGIDSNFPGITTYWTPAELEQAFRHSGRDQCLLITKNEMKWPHRISH